MWYIVDLPGTPREVVTSSLFKTNATLTDMRRYEIRGRPSSKEHSSSEGCNKTPVREGREWFALLSSRLQYS
jgi:hypothetical protein